MTELVKHSTERSSDAAAYAAMLLHHYGFDLGGYTIAQLLLAWQEPYPAAWIRLATIEALYQGRYKAISVEQILALWQRRNQPLYHFNHEFERLVCDNLPETLLLADPAPQSDLAARSTSRLETKLPYRSAALRLPSFEVAPQPESDVMVALRTLHSEEMALLAESQKRTEADPQTALQTYSYKLGSSEPPMLPTQDGNTSLQGSDSLIQAEEPPPASPLECSEIDQPAVIEETEQNHEAVQNEAVQNEAVQNEVTQNEVTQNEVTQNDLTVPTADPSASMQSSTAEPLTTVEPLTVREAVKPFPPSDVQLPPTQTESIARILQQLDAQALQAQDALPVLRLRTPTLRPKLQLHLTARYQPIWLTDASSKEPIHQFTPELEQTEFHNKLKAVAQPAEEPCSEESTVNPDA